MQHGHKLAPAEILPRFMLSFKREVSSFKREVSSFKREMLSFKREASGKQAGGETGGKVP